MNITALPLDGAFEITLERREDARGYFARSYCDAEFSAAGLNTFWPQMNISMNAEPGTLRGLHFQREPAAEVKIVRCLQGRAMDFIVDLRAGSPGYGQHIALELASDVFNAIYIPKGFAHGFQTLAADTVLQYMHSTSYAPGHEGGINPLDPSLGISWPLPPANLSERDSLLPPISRIKPL